MATRSVRSRKSDCEHSFREVWTTVWIGLHRHRSSAHIPNYQDRNDSQLIGAGVIFRYSGASATEDRLWRQCLSVESALLTLSSKFCQRQKRQQIEVAVW